MTELFASWGLHQVQLCCPSISASLHIGDCIGTCDKFSIEQLYMNVTLKNSLVILNTKCSLAFPVIWSLFWCFSSLSWGNVDWWQYFGFCLFLCGIWKRNLSGWIANIPVQYLASFKNNRRTLADWEKGWLMTVCGNFRFCDFFVLDKVGISDNGTF